MNNNNKDILAGSYYGFNRGNMFDNIYSEYKNYKPMRLSPGNEKEQYLLDLDQVQFGMHEINLYLDVYPNDIDMINEFNKYREKYMELLSDYQSKYGPLEVCSMDYNNHFDWANNPWPWEGV